ncbi:MAG: galactosyldiacylglycerol synthase [Chloroflexi bacterium]|nr:galactosyldiacylglycerol synthase [Chloroflexota bacterium]MCL5273707.1 galactosyldiacylglycerol synthase [Chloroflexota bacterium]
MTRIVLLYGDSGGGHRSAADAIAMGLRELYGNRYDIAYLNGFKFLPPLLRNVDVDYPMWVNYGRMLYALSYHASNGRRRVAAIRRVFESISDQAAEDIISAAPADVYVSCHPIFNEAIPAAIRRLKLSSRFINVVTDLVSGHVAHYVPEVDHCIVPTEESRQHALDNLVAPEKITVTGQPVWPDFRTRMGNRLATRAEMGLDNTKPVVLLMGGGDGMGRLGVTGQEIAFSGLPLQLVVVCGRNQTVKRDMEYINPRVPMKVLGFVKNIPELMGAADILVTKAGPGTIAEAFIAGLPILLYDAVPGQEEGNVDYVVDRGAGAWCPFLPSAVTRQLKLLLADPKRLEHMRAASARLARPDSALDIARIVSRYACD